MAKIIKKKIVKKIVSDEDEFLDERDEKESTELLDSFEDDYSDLGYYRDIKESMDRW